jgi:kynureninase
MSASSPQEQARALDAADPLAGFRAHFAQPRDADGRALTYLCGHSLGLAPLGARAAVTQEIERWQSLGVLGHEQGEPDWVNYADGLQQPLAELAGAHPDEVVAMNSLSVNLHLLLAAFYRPRSARRAILIEAGAFSSDRHVVASQIALHGGDARHELIELAPRPGQDLLEPDEIDDCIARHADRLALVLWPGVQFRTGQRFDVARITRAAHVAGAIAGFDLAHAIGNVPLSLHAAQADFAAWCSYKYLNGGPGAVGGAFIHERHLQQAGVSHLAGWWGHELATRFDMPPGFVPAHGAAAWAISNPPIFSTAPLRASLPLFQQAGLTALRAKSKQLTAYLASQLRDRTGDALSIVTPADSEARGCQLSLRLRRDGAGARRIFDRLRQQAVVADWRAPDIIRVAPVPLYNSYQDTLSCAQLLAEALSDDA